MKKLFLAAIAAATCSLAANAASISYTAQQTEFSEETEYGDVDIVFKKCMANNLYTFYSVKLNGYVVNQTGSDNIGPFAVSGKGWIGGNHLNGSAITANTLNVSVAVDGQELTHSTTLEGSVLTINVENELLNPDGTIFAKEFVTYNVSGNSIEVNAKHEFMCAAYVEAYYGMQSMFVDEYEILTPGGLCSTWTTIVPASSEDNQVAFKKVTAPKFCTYVEHSKYGYQAAYLFPEDLGTHSRISSFDVVFRGNNWRKSYHKLLGDNNIKKGEVTKWHGLYSWFDAPLADNCKSETDDLTFSYGAYIGGKATTMNLAADGVMTVGKIDGIEDLVVDNETAIAVAGDGAIIVDAADASVYTPAGALVAKGTGEHSVAPGVYVVADGQGHNVKLSVK